MPLIEKKKTDKTSDVNEDVIGIAAYTVEQLTIPKLASYTVVQHSVHPQTHRYRAVLVFTSKHQQGPTSSLSNRIKPLNNQICTQGIEKPSSL